LILVGKMWRGLLDWAKESLLRTDLALASPNDLEIPRCVDTGDEAITLLPEPPAPPETSPTVFLLHEIESITWDRLEKQQTRSQVRFRLKNGDLHTFSGRLPEPD